jgi:hypothetical protein
MTEAEWLACDEPRPMLEFQCDEVSDRKLRLMLCAWSRSNWNWLPRDSRSAVEVAELFADGVVSDADRESADAGPHVTTTRSRNPAVLQPAITA